MEQLWVQIQDFPRYAVSNLGLVQNLDTGRFMRQSLNSHGIPIVGMMRSGVQHKRSVTLLVAERFLDRPDSDYTNPTPINLNGNPLDNSVNNLAWRPRWFAYSYAKQFKCPRLGFDSPVQELNTFETFPNSWIAAQTFGILDRDLVRSIVEYEEVWPTRQLFRLVT